LSGGAFEFVEQIIDIIVSAINQMLSSLGNGIVELFAKLLLDDNGQLTAFAAWSFVFIGISLAISLVFGIIRKVG
jgi:hypothetical protein